MNSAMLKSAVDEIRLAINQGQQEALYQVLTDVCLIDALQIVVAACEDSIAGMPGRIANFMYDLNDPEIGNHEFVLRQSMETIGNRLIRKLAGVDAEEDGRCASVAWAIEALKTETEVDRDVIAGVAYICSNSQHARQLFEKHLQYAIENDSISELA